MKGGRRGKEGKGVGIFIFFFFFFFIFLFFMGYDSMRCSPNDTTCYPACMENEDIYIQSHYGDTS